MHPSNKITPENIAAVLRYKPPTPDQTARHEYLAEAAEKFAAVVLACVPDCADRSAAIRHIRDAKMTASAAIALEE